MRVTKRVEQYIANKVEEMLTVPKPKELENLEAVVSAMDAEWEKEYQKFKDKFIAKMEFKHPELKALTRNDRSGRLWNVHDSELAKAHRAANAAATRDVWNITQKICTELELGTYKGNLDEIIAKYCSK